MSNWPSLALRAALGSPLLALQALHPVGVQAALQADPTAVGEADCRAFGMRSAISS